jgi:hypothetical protein
MHPATLSVAGATALVLALVLCVEPPSGAPLADPELAAVGADLNGGFRVADQRLAARREVARAVAEERLPFAAAADGFLSLLREAPEDAEVARTRYPGATDAERAAQQLIEFVKEVDLPPSQRAAVTARLDAEFAAHFGRPAVPTA